VLLGPLPVWPTIWVLAPDVPKGMYRMPPELVVPVPETQKADPSSEVAPRTLSAVNPSSMRVEVSALNEASTRAITRLTVCDLMDATPGGDA
jgi:hypothetical protein